MNESLPVSARLRLDEVLTRFEKAWAAAGSGGPVPRIEVYLGDTTGPERQALLRELLRLDLHHRRRCGESPGAEDYAACCPGDAEAIRAVLAEVATDPPRGEQPATDANRTTPEAPPRPATGEPPYPTIPGYEIQGRLGRGGMGEVVRGRDLHMGRDLAVKVLLPKYRHEPDLVQRFLAEGRIQGRLQHPGIVPVHELGELPDQRPYFTMKLVEGRTLADLLKERTDPTQDLPHFLTIFQQVCQAVAYAHSNGVIHRDLKPQNVMVGAFGEVQVMDWGLAKALDRGRGGPAAEPAGSAVVNGQGASDGDLGLATQPGAVLGTYAYMAPEQARGEVDQLDEHADVFGLGAILCEILTGRPPFTGAGRDDLARRAQTCDHAEALAALDASGADTELVRLAKGCLAAEAAARPADAGAVAAAITAYLAGVQERLRRAELERAAAEARAAEERRRRRAQLGLAAAVLALVAVGVGGGLWIREQAAARRQMVASTLEKMTELRDQMRFREAEAVLKQGQAALGERGPDDLRRQLDVAERELALVNRLDAIRQQRAILIEGHFDFRRAERNYAAEFLAAGLAEEGQEAAAMAARVRDSAVGEQLVAALDDWAAVTTDPQRRVWLLEVARRADPDAWRDHFRDPQVWRDRVRLEALAKELLDDERLLVQQKPPLLAALATALDSTQADAVPLLAAGQARYPDDFWLNFQLGIAFDKAKRWDEAVAFYRAAFAIRPSAVAVRLDLSRVLQEKGQLNEAIRECRIAIELDPTFAGFHNNLGMALKDKGQLDEAIREFRIAIELDPTYAPAHNNLGAALKVKGQLDEAIREYRKALELDPKDPCPHQGLGNALYKRGHLDGAIREYHRAIELNPKLGPPHHGLGMVLHDKGQLDEAIREYHTAIDLDPKDAGPHAELGLTLLQLGRFDEALEDTRRGLDLMPPDAPSRQGVGRQLKTCEELLALERKLSAIQEGTEAPANSAERLALAQLCAKPFKKRYAAAARFCADAFAADSNLAADLREQHRYNAARLACLAGCGRGEDARALPDKAALGLRRQALGWLRADLAAYAKFAERDDPAAKQAVRQRLEHWRQDADLAPVRDPQALDQLPDDERRQWRQLWDDVTALLAKVGAAP